MGNGRREVWQFFEDLNEISEVQFRFFISERKLEPIIPRGIDTNVVLSLNINHEMDIVTTILKSFGSKVFLSFRPFGICLIVTKNPDVCRQKDFVFSFGHFN